ncbi:basic amino acid ABC transporter substrate-binding protein [Pleomorphochaeta sp. DL1XJH-081]|uniref:basic amino acid ABC transporter substrate-binding protein n=1 Tax=Pleomorphochaeta sp. DL1XJH-081 TaxID=3409690 RepID=UPI003BB5F6CB
MKKTLLVCATMLMFVSILFAGGAKESEGYVFGSDCTWPPLEFVDENGEIVGFEIDLIAAMSERSGIPMTVRNVAWDGIFAGLNNGAYDAVASGVTVLEERKATMDFTTPILEVTQSIIVNNSSTGISDEKDLSGKTVGVQIGTTGHFAVEKIPGVTVKAYDEIGLAVEDLLNQNLDAVVADSIIAADFVLANENYANKLNASGSLDGDVEQIAMAVKKGNTELLNIINENIAALEADGTIAALKDKWNIL